MNSKERVIKCLKFDNPDRIPVDLWLLPGTITKYGEKVTKLRELTDFAGIDVDDPTNDSRQHQKGYFVDAWGCGWYNAQDGIIGEVKEHPLADDSKIDSYKTPLNRWSEACYKNTAESYKNRQDKFIITGHYNLFERMQFLRGTENLYMDIAEENNEFFKIRDMVADYYLTLLDRILKYDFDALALFDDWGSQRAPLISPDSWRRLFKPVYKELIDRAKAKGRFVFFHSDGHIFKLYDEFIDLGVDAINSQLWCMGVDEVAESFAGRITFWGEISRQDILPRGSAEDVVNAANKLKEKLFVNGGGLIGQFEAGSDVPTENIEAGFYAWNK